MANEYCDNKVFIHTDPETGKQRRYIGCDTDQAENKAADQAVNKAVDQAKNKAADQAANKAYISIINRLKEKNQSIPENMVITIYEENDNTKIYRYECSQKPNF